MNGIKKMSKNDKILITGGLGFIGSHLAKIIIEKKIASKCILLDSFGGFINPIKDSFMDYRKHRFVDNKNIIIERGNAGDFRLIYKILDKYKPKIIFHASAVPLAKLDNISASECRRGSVDTTTNILECINFFQSKKRFKLNRFLYFSSSMVYGDFKKSKVSEKEQLNPKEIYGTMKLAGEIVTKGLCNFYKIPYTIIRPSAVYGPTDMNQRVTQIFLEKALKGEQLKIQGKDEKLDFTFVEDLAEGCVLAARSKKAENNIFNITFGKAQTLYKYVKILSKYFKDLKFSVEERDHLRPKRGTLSIKKAQLLLKYKPKYNLEKGMKKYIEFTRSLRKKEVVEVIEPSQKNYKTNKLNPKKINIIAIIPVRGETQKLAGKYQIAYTIKAAQKSKYINDIFVSTDSKQTAKVAKSLGAKSPFIRPEYLSESHVDIKTVQKYSLGKIEQKGVRPDLVVHLEQTFPFRPYEIIDEMIIRLLQDGYDSVMAAHKEAGSFWHESRNQSIRRIDKGDIPREFKEKSLVGLQGLCCVTRPEFIRKNSLLGKKIGLYEIKNQISGLEVRSRSDKSMAEKIIKNFKI